MFDLLTLSAFIEILSGRVIYAIITLRRYPSRAQTNLESSGFNQTTIRYWRIDRGTFECAGVVCAEREPFWTRLKPRCQLKGSRVSQLHLGRVKRTTDELRLEKLAVFDRSPKMLWWDIFTFVCFTFLRFCHWMKIEDIYLFTVPQSLDLFLHWPNNQSHAHRKLPADVLHSHCTTANILYYCELRMSWAEKFDRNECPTWTWAWKMQYFGSNSTTSARIRRKSDSDLTYLVFTYLVTYLAFTPTTRSKYRKIGKTWWCSWWYKFGLTSKPQSWRYRIAVYVVHLERPRASRPRKPWILSRGVAGLDSKARPDWQGAEAWSCASGEEERVRVPRRCLCCPGYGPPVRCDPPTVEETRTAVN